MRIQLNLNRAQENHLWELATVRKDVAPSPLRYRGTPQGAVTPITQE